MRALAVALARLSGHVHAFPVRRQLLHVGCSPLHRILRALQLAQANAYRRDLTDGTEGVHDAGEAGDAGVWLRVISLALAVPKRQFHTGRSRVIQSGVAVRYGMFVTILAPTKA